MHKSSEEEVQGVVGRMRVNNGHLDSTIKQVTIPVSGKTMAKEIVRQALIQFDMLVSEGVSLNRGGWMRVINCHFFDHVIALNSCTKWHLLYLEASMIFSNGKCEMSGHVKCSRGSAAFITPTIQSAFPPQSP